MYSNATDVSFDELSFDGMLAMQIELANGAGFANRFDVKPFMDKHVRPLKFTVVVLAQESSGAMVEVEK